MGYTHYWRRPLELERDAFAQLVSDVKKIIDVSRQKGLRLTGPTGYGEPDATDFSIAFNGAKECGHDYVDLGKPWPSKTAEGVEATEKPIVGPWFSGALIETRVCGGSCAGAPFVIDRRFMLRPWDQVESGRFFCACETDYKPYDLAVTAALIRLKEQFGDAVQISSDGRERGFEDGKRLCRELFGWPTRFELEREDTEVL